jgi:hypothetical protein
MEKRLFIMLTILVLIGGIAGTFSSSIMEALTPSMLAMQGNTTHSGQMSSGTKTAQSTGKQSGNSPTATQVPTAPTQIPAIPTPSMVLAQDTFQRPNQQLWGQSSDGRQWQGDANTSRAFSIHASTGQVVGAGTVNAILGNASDDVNVLLSGQVNQFGSGVNMGAVLRWKDNNNWYKALIDGQHLIVLRRVNGVSDQLQSVPFQAQAGIVYNIRFQAIGVLLFAKVWQSGKPEPANWMIMLSDMSLQSGQVGLRLVLQSQTVINVTSFLATPGTMGDGS